MAGDRLWTWSWYTTPAGNDVVRDEIDKTFKKLPRAPKVELAELMERIARGETLRSDVTDLRNGLLEARLSYQGMQFRLYFGKNQRGLVLLALKFQRKGGQGAQKREIRKARDRLADAKRRDIC
ncbi:type II toxin-antitoxin system RelE/ParE family toxin [Nocardiopsis sp. LOL_012]|uniref:type II toxin-antitoxin system RelE/ParE family toxin n=1 Tax=Nocardiopsis sp. LOL_012 TaxID=3345409 RepID=UPI003A85FAC2